MPSSADAGSGQDAAIIVNDLAQHFVIMEDLLHPLQPVANTVTKLVSQVAEQGQQQQALNLALLHLEHGTNDADASAPAPNGPTNTSANHGSGGDDSIRLSPRA
jgi:hypothetical protein